MPISVTGKPTHAHSLSRSTPTIRLHIVCVHREEKKKKNEMEWMWSERTQANRTNRTPTRARATCMSHTHGLNGIYEFATHRIGVGCQFIDKKIIFKNRHIIIIVLQPATTHLDTVAMQKRHDKRPTNGDKFFYANELQLFCDFCCALHAAPEHKTPRVYAICHGAMQWWFTFDRLAGLTIWYVTTNQRNVMP